jgi:hypothetical protein
MFPVAVQRVQTELNQLLAHLEADGLGVRLGLEVGDVLGSLAQGGDAKDDHAKAIEQVLAGLLFADGRRVWRVSALSMLRQPQRPDSHPSCVRGAAGGIGSVRVAGQGTGSAARRHLPTVEAAPDFAEVTGAPPLAGFPSRVDSAAKNRAGPDGRRRMHKQPPRA